MMMVEQLVVRQSTNGLQELAARDRAPNDLHHQSNRLDVEESNAYTGGRKIHSVRNFTSHNGLAVQSHDEARTQLVPRTYGTENNSPDGTSSLQQSSTEAHRAIIGRVAHALVSPGEHEKRIDDAQEESPPPLSQSSSICVCTGYC